jgi:putative thioredoxin
LREFLSRHVQPSEVPEEESVVADDAPPVETPEQTIARIQQEIAAQPDQADLKLDLAVAQMSAGNAPAAEAELDALPANLATDERAKRLRGQLEFARVLKDAPTESELRARIARNANDYEARDLLGMRLLASGNAAEGLQLFIDLLQADRNWNEGQARKRLVAAFNVLDDADLVGTYRRKMSALLF